MMDLSISIHLVTQPNPATPKTGYKYWKNYAPKNIGRTHCLDSTTLEPEMVLSTTWEQNKIHAL